MQEWLINLDHKEYIHVVGDKESLLKEQCPFAVNVKTMTTMPM